MYIHVCVRYACVYDQYTHMRVYKRVYVHNIHACVFTYVYDYNVYKRMCTHVYACTCVSATDLRRSHAGAGAHGR